jgi:hypothetical protein
MFDICSRIKVARKGVLSELGHLVNEIRTSPAGGLLGYKAVNQLLVLLEPASAPFGIASVLRCHDLDDQLRALIANEHGWTGDQRKDFVLALAAE